MSSNFSKSYTYDMHIKIVFNYKEILHILPPKFTFIKLALQ